MELCEGLLLGVDKAVSRLDAIAHHLALIAQQGEELEVLGGISDQVADIGDELYTVLRPGQAPGVGQRDRHSGEGALSIGGGRLTSGRESSSGTGADGTAREVTGVPTPSPGTPRDPADGPSGW